MGLFSRLVDLVNHGDLEVEENGYAKRIICATDYFDMSYDVQIPVKTAYKWLEKAYNRNCRLKVVPNKEYLEERNLQLNGWEQHFELDI